MRGVFKWRCHARRASFSVGRRIFERSLQFIPRVQHKIFYARISDHNTFTRFVIVRRVS